MTIRMVTVTACLCFAMALCAFAADNKKEATGEKFNDMDLTPKDFTARHFQDNSTFEDSDCKNVRFDKCIAKEAIFIGADLTHSSFIKADVTGADFHKAKMDRMYFSYAILDGANLEGVDLNSTNFYTSKLRRANLKNLKWIGEAHYCDFTGANVCGADLSRMDIGGSKDGYPIFAKAKYDKDTHWPAKIDPVEAGAVLVTEDKDK
jgi:uncharacterized protein YjbI with pentapeptide repeats